MISILLSVSGIFAQPGKDGAYTVSSGSLILNKYVPVSANIAVGDNTLSIASSLLVTFCPGDLIMVYQAQGAGMNITNTSSYGTITNYNSAGLYEFKYVQSASGNIITTQTTFTNSYAVAGRVQVIKVPQYTSLTVNAGASIVPKPWKDTVIATIPYRFGGLVVLHTSSIVNNGTITATNFGFRGGAYTNDVGLNMGATAYCSPLSTQGGEKGEGIFGYQHDYDLNGGRYCMGAPINGGGGGNNHNSGGGGGGNGYNGNAWSGQGVMIVNASNPIAGWTITQAYISNGNSLTNSSGGGRGGYTYGDANGNALVDPPAAAVWVGDVRREVGGYGGQALTNINAETRIYFGGGGGAPHANNYSSSGGTNGGGIVYLIATGGITGAGTISSDVPVAGNSSVCACDAAPGGGAGGSIVIKTGAIASTQNVSANGGNGGNQFIPMPPASYYESEGPGAGGGGGFVAISAGGVTPSIKGGSNGTTLSHALTEMTSNGATSGGDGQIGLVSNAFISFIPFSGSASMSSNGPVCAGSALSFSASPATTYSWSGPGGFSSNSQNPNIINTLPSISGIYSVTETITSPCFMVLTGTLNVIVNPLPTPSITATKILCEGQALNLTATGGANYIWQGPSSFSSVLQNPVINPAPVGASGIYTVLAIDANGCSASVTSDPVTVDSLPVVTVTNISACEGQSVSLSASSNAASFTWHGPNNFTSSFLNPGLGLATMAQQGAYTLNVTSAAGCTASAVAGLTVHAAPAAPTLSSNGIVCSSGIINLSSSASTSYAWQGPAGFTSSVQNPSFAVTSINQAGTYTLTITDLNGCTASNTVGLVVDQNVVPQIAAIGVAGCAPYCTSFTCTDPSAANWQMGDGSTVASSSIAAVCYHLPGIYTVTAEPATSGCKGTTTFTVLVYPKPVADFNYAPYHPLAGLDEVTFTDASHNAAISSWSWFFMDNAEFTSALQNLAFTYPDAGIYAIALVVTSEQGCTDTLLKSIEVNEDMSLWVPNAFTPNNDGLNDVFFAKGYGIAKFSMSIFDRWGEKVFTADDIHKAWDGTFEGRGTGKCKEDTYTWMIDVTDTFGKSKNKTGHVTLMR